MVPADPCSIIQLYSGPIPAFEYLLLCVTWPQLHSSLPCIHDATERPNDTPEVAEHSLAVPAPPDGDFWYLHVHGASNYKGSRAGIVLVIQTVRCLGFKVSNNKAEYETLLAGFRMAKDLAVKKLTIHSDSQLITSQTA
ncbi:hypothetical protein ACFX10_014913 [Malus domestica]